MDYQSYRESIINVNTEIKKTDFYAYIKKFFIVKKSFLKKKAEISFLKKQKI